MKKFYLIPQAKCKNVSPQLWGAVTFKAGYRGGRIFGGLTHFLASFYWCIKYFGKIVKYLMGCEIFWNIFQTEARIMHSFTTKVSSVSV